MQRRKNKHTHFVKTIQNDHKRMKTCQQKK